MTSSITPVHILYGSETGSAEFLCDDLQEALAAGGIDATITEFDSLDVHELAGCDPALIIISTTGDGDMPQDTEGFWEALDAHEAPDCTGLRYAVLALGDRVYTYFCNAGRLLDERLTELGATRLAARTDCDAAYDRPATEWIAQRVTQLAGEIASEREAMPADDAAPVALAAASTTLPAPVAPATPAIPSTAATPRSEPTGEPRRSPWSRENPFSATVITSTQIGGPIDGVETFHVELDLTGSGMALEPGDSIGVIPTNDPYAVEQFLAAAQIDASDPSHRASALDAATRQWEIRFPSLALLEAAFPDADAQQRKRWVEVHTVADTLRLLPGPLDRATLIPLMAPIRPRAYSLATSPLAHTDRADLTVSARTLATGTMRTGAAGGFLAYRLRPGDRVPVFPLPNRNFRLPDDPATPIIMVATGAGIAPFRSFLQHRAAQDDPGPAWLIFGNRSEERDFLYRDELAGWLRSGVLTELHTAFSRDQARKIYVQDRIREHASEITYWLDDGAYWYVCGSADRMAPAVEAALGDALTDALGPARAPAFRERLRVEKRHRVDVY